MRRTVYPLLIMLLALLLSACSGLPPQRLELHPPISAVPRLSEAPPVSVHVANRSAQLQIGTVSDRTGNQAPVSLTHQAPEQIRRAAIEALTRMRVPAPVADARTRMTLIVDDLFYHLRSDGIRRELVGTLRLRVQVIDGVHQYEGAFEATHTEEVVRTPDEAKSEMFVNNLVGEVMSNAFNDPRLSDFLLARARGQ